MAFLMPGRIGQLFQDPMPFHFPAFLKKGSILNQRINFFRQLPVFIRNYIARAVRI